MSATESGAGDQEATRNAVLYAMGLLRTTGLSDAALAEVERIENAYTATPDADDASPCDRRGPGGECVRDHEPCPDFPAPAASTDASGALSDQEAHALADAARSTNLTVSDLQLDAIEAEVERIVAARESAAATRARAEGAGDLSALLSEPKMRRPERESGR